MDTQNGKDLVYDSELFTVWGTIISNTEVVKIRVDPRFRPNINDNIQYKKGDFDMALPRRNGTSCHSPGIVALMKRKIHASASMKLSNI